MPLAFILIGEMFSLEQRTKMQGVFSGVWGVSSIAGPLLGGFLVDSAFMALDLLHQHYSRFAGRGAGRFCMAGPDSQSRKTRCGLHGRGVINSQCHHVSAWADGVRHIPQLDLYRGRHRCFSLSCWWVERRAADPILPLPLFRDASFPPPPPTEC